MVQAEDKKNTVVGKANFGPIVPALHFLIFDEFINKKISAMMNWTQDLLHHL